MTKAGKNLGVSFLLHKLENVQTTKKGDEFLNELKKINYNDGKIIAIFVLDKSTKSLNPFIKNFLYT